jgi:hypothetical protein
VLRILEDNLLGLFVMVLSGKRRQRIGDLLGGTAVTRASDIPGLPSPSPLVVVYPVLWVGAALAYSAMAPGPDPYLMKVAAICDARTDAQDRMPRPLDMRVVIEMSAEETRRIARLRPTPEYRLWHREVVREKRDFDKLGRVVMHEMANSPDPQQIYFRYEQSLFDEMEQHNTLFAEAGLRDCAR